MLSTKLTESATVHPRHTDWRQKSPLSTPIPSTSPTEHFKLAFSVLLQKKTWLHVRLFFISEGLFTASGVWLFLHWVNVAFQCQVGWSVGLQDPTKLHNSWRDGGTPRQCSKSGNRAPLVLWPPNDLGMCWQQVTWAQSGAVTCSLFICLSFTIQFVWDDGGSSFQYIII